MADLADYLRNERAAIDARMEAQAKSLSDYRKNQLALESLGQEDKSKKKPGLVNRLFGALGYLSAPGDLVKAGILEAIGRPTEELQGTSGFQQVKDILSRKIDVTGEEFNKAAFGIESSPSDSILRKVAKKGLGFATDIVTDPLSFVAAPASISRKAASEALLNVANKADFLDDVVRASKKGTGLVDELVAATPVARAAEIQRAAAKAAEEAGDVAAATKIVDTPGAPVKTLEDVGTKNVAAQSLADRLSQTLYTKGRTGLMKELEALTGSKEAAMKIFKSLPEDVRGGIVLAKPLTGSPFKTKDGQYIRLTQGTGAALPFAEPLNVVRQALGVAANPITRNFSGQAGNILADVKKAAFAGRNAEEEAAQAAPRFIDYVTTKKAITERAIKRNELQAIATSAVKEAKFAGKDFEGDEAIEFGESLKDAFFTPAKYGDDSAPVVLTPASQAGVDASRVLRERFNEIYEEAKKAGVDIGNIGSPFEYSPLMLKDSAFQRMKRLGTATGDTNAYRMERGRGSHIEYIPDPDIAREVGFVDPKNPGVTYLNPKAINDKLEERAREAATAAGRSKEDIDRLAEEARIYIEDPELILQKYGNYVANSAASKRFVDIMRSTGTLIRDVPKARKLLEELNTATFAAALDNLDPEIRKLFKERADQIEKQILDEDFGSVLNLRKSEYIDFRNRAIEARNAGDIDLADQLEEAARNTRKDIEKFADDAVDQVDKDSAGLLLDAADKLEQVDYEVFSTLIDRNEIETLLERLSKLDRDDPAAFGVVNDLYKVFGNLKSKLPDEVFEKLTKIQQDVVTGEGFLRLRNQLLRQESEPGAIATELVDQGYQALGTEKTKAFANLYATSGVAEAIDFIYKSQSNPDSWKRFIESYVDPLLGAWKLAATTGRGPAYVINNLIGGMFNNHVGGVSAELHLVALGAMRKLQKQVKILEKANPQKTFYEINRMAEQAVMAELNRTVINGKGLGDLFAEFNRLGGFEQTDISAATQMALRETPTGEMAATLESFSKQGRLKRTYPEPPAGKGEAAVRKITEFTTTNKAQMVMNDLSQQSEVFLRLAAFLDGYKKFGDIDAAMAKTKMLHFDYRDLGPGEEWLRRLMPFYTWSRNNVPLQFRTILMQPGKIQRAVKAQQAIGGVFETEEGDSWLNEVMPEWLEKKGGMITGIASGMGNLALTPNLPFMNVNDVTSRQGLLGLLGPAIQAPIEMVSQRSLETGAPLTRGALDTFLSNVTPYYSTGRNIATAAGVPVPGEEGKQLQRLLALTGAPALGGFQLGTVTPENITSELEQRSRRQYDQIKQAAGVLGVDTDWIRRNLDKGIDPKTLAMVIQAGGGRTAQSLGAPVNENRISDTRRRRALEAIASLGQG